MIKVNVKIIGRNSEEIDSFADEALNLLGRGSFAKEEESLLGWGQEEEGKEYKMDLHWYVYRWLIYLHIKNACYRVGQLYKVIVDDQIQSDSPKI